MARVEGNGVGRRLAGEPIRGPPLIDRAVGVVWAVGGRARVVWDFTIRDGRIVHIDMLAARHSLADVDLTILDG